MAQQTINVGAAPNDGTGTPLRTAFQYTNSNFSELYTAVGPSGNNIVVPGSATITGDLTVKTNVLKVDTTNNRVGVNTASPAQALDVASGNLQVRTGGTIYSDTFSNYGAALQINAAGSLPLRLQIGGSNAYEITSANVHTWQNVGGVAGTAMTLNSTGLLVGTTATSYGAAGRGLVVAGGSTSAIIGMRVGSTDTGYIFADATKVELGGNGAVPIVINNGGAAITIDTARNVGIGVTPSAWATYKAVSVGGIGASVFGLGTSQAGVAQGAFFNNGAGSGWAYSATSQVPTYYLQINGENIWNIAASGTAGAQITAWTPAMKLDASGNLLVGTTGLNGSWNTKLTLSNDSGTTKWAVGPYLGGVTNFLISAGASAGVYLNGTAATSWTSASDERLKDIIEPISNAIAKVGSLRAVIGKFKFDENNTRKPFLIAQDIQAVLPEAVDASNPEKLGVAYTDVIPLLVAAIKELTAEVNALKNA